MAELLVLMTGSNPDPMAWQTGHVVAVMPDGHTWGALECPPRFCVVSVAMTVEEAQVYLEPEVVDDGL
jgi:hypothetical protein